MAYTATLAIALITAAAGGLIGYRIRWREFRREQRLRVYGEFVAAFINVSRAGSALLSLHTMFGDAMWDKANDDEVQPLMVDWRDSYSAHEVTTTQLRLVASRDVRQASERLENYLDTNVLATAVF